MIISGSRRPSALQICFTALLPLLFLFGCSAAGTQVKVEKAVPLSPGRTMEGVHSTTDFRLEYTVLFKQEDPKVPGSFELKGYLKPVSGLGTLRILLHFLDERNTVLSTERLYDPGPGRGAARGKLNNVFETPPGTAAFGFTHLAREKIEMF